MRNFVFFLLMLAGTASADTAEVDCWWRGSSGERFELGDITCFTISGRSFTAQCQMSLNNPMWRELHEGCVGA